MKTNATPLTPRKLVTALLFRFASFYAFLGLILFLPAGTLRYWEAWVSIIMLTVPVLFLVVYLYKRDPGLLERRMRTKETQRTQKVVIILSSLSLFLVFIIPGFDHRFGWSSVPVPLTIISQLFILAGYWLFALVLKTNSYASRIIEVEKGQKVVTTGPYSLVRHPMYLAVLVIYGFFPLALGSFWAVLPVATLIPLLVARIKGEEKVLLSNLGDYKEYTLKTKSRLVPGVW